MNMIEAVRKQMEERNIDYLMLVDSDPHFSEYVNDYYKFRSLVSGFTGSNGTLILGKNDGYLFTDGRYFIQAENQLKGTGISLMKLGIEGYPTLIQFLDSLSKNGMKIAALEDCISISMYEKLPIDYLDSDYSIIFNAYKEAYGKEYPNIIFDEFIEELPLEIAGESRESKISKIRNSLDKLEADLYISSTLEDNMWLLNIRGRAIPCNPVSICYLTISKDSVDLYLLGNNDFKLSNVNIHTYDSFKEYLKITDSNTKIVLEKSSFSAGNIEILKNRNVKIIDSDLNIKLMKSIKNETEIENIRKYYYKDNEIVTRFINELNDINFNEYNEYDLAMKLDNMRKSDPDCFDLSFDTISASGPNGAMMHYQASFDKNSKILNNSLYLFDSGGQWKGATTDITRTILVGEATYEMKHDYTRVVRGLLNLSNAVFMEGCTGVNLDILAREPMWEEGDDYKCGTGHGIGYILSVHEGPNAIRWKSNPSDAILKPGMIMSCEPGIYKEGKYGIRIENILLVKEKCKTNDGVFLCFETLTYVPLDMKLILLDEMNNKEIKWLEEYNMKCNKH
ncbi:MAG: aminopeptidase P family protein [Lachnospiraceae bacterium]|nr:aminopeptidase P family protein [Lachnospiraceae bacterium]